MWKRAIHTPSSKHLHDSMKQINTKSKNQHITGGCFRSEKKKLCVQIRSYKANKLAFLVGKAAKHAKAVTQNEAYESMNTAFWLIKKAHMLRWYERAHVFGQLVFESYQNSRIGVLMERASN